MDMRPTKFGIGQSVKRVEDIRLVSGRGNYASDAADKADLKAVFLRSPYGHAKFRIDDVEAARAAPGVRRRRESRSRKAWRHSGRATPAGWAAHCGTGRPTIAAML